jgi:hypothetical protein
MATIRNDARHSALLALETAAASARGGFACMFSSSDEYETALITERRAQGRYTQPTRSWRIMAFAAVALMVAGTVVFLG